MNKYIINMIVLIISDRVYHKNRVDETMPMIQKWLLNKPANLVKHFIIPDEANAIRKTIRDALRIENIDVIITSGGTGFSKRDITPEISSEFIKKFTPGIDEYLRFKGTEITPFAALSRGISGIVDNKMIINLPGNPKGVIESLTWLLELLPHGINLIKGSKSDGEHNR
jgi:molybdopterin adenylyltransferase